MSVIYKYPIDTTNVPVTFYAGSRVVSVGLDLEGKPAMWIEHQQTSFGEITKSVIIVMTGEEYDLPDHTPVGTFAYRSLICHALMERINAHPNQ